jgi:hypothetical protein
MNYQLLLIPLFFILVLTIIITLFLTRKNSQDLPRKILTALLAAILVSAILFFAGLLYIICCVRLF